MSAPASSTAATATAAATPLPSAEGLQQAAKVAIELDKPILLDYYVETAQRTAFLGEDDTTKERLLVKSKDEFTSLVQKMYRLPGNDIAVLTENSIYIVSGNLQKRKIQASTYLTE